MISQPPRSIVITGASSGIGAALALEYAASGTQLALTGRDAGRLTVIADEARGRGATVTADVVDVRDPAAMAAWLMAVDDAQPIDLLIANAGVSAGTGLAGEGEAVARAIVDINVLGVFNTVFPILPRLRDRGRGQVAIVASLASFRGVPGAPAYCASKAAVRVWGEGLRGELAPHGVGVSVICPGFVRSRITDQNDFAMPFFMEADQAARIIRAGLARNKGRIAFPRPMVAATWVLNALPSPVADWLVSRLPRKAGGTI